MITLVGTGHIFNVAEQVSFIIKQIWPDAVLVELDRGRYEAMTNPDAEIAETSKQYRKAAEYQQRLASEYDTTSGAELIAAVNTGKVLGSDILFIDTNAEEMLQRVWDEMPFRERMRFRFMSIKEGIFSKKATVEETFDEFCKDEKRSMEYLCERYPTFYRIIVEERNEYMAEQINKASERYDNIVAVIGDGHVEGVAEMLKEKNIKKIRLRDLMNKERMDAIRSELWTHGPVEE